MHEVPLVTTIAAAFTAALVLGLITQKLKLSPIVGYLLAGVAIGSHTPGFVGDAKLAGQLAELGVVLLMFGVGLHFHLKDLLKVWHVALPGAIGQSAIITLMGLGIESAFGWPVKSGLVFGMAAAVASTVVLIRVLTDNRLLDTTAGHVAVGWLVVEDVLTVVVLVLIPAMGNVSSADHAAAHSSVGWTLFVAMAKLGVLVGLFLIAGSRVIPWIMVRIARLRSRELFTLTVLVMSVAVAAGAAHAFGASMALGAFLAGMVVGQSPVSHQAAADALPLRDAFAVLFFVSVGMLFDPMFVVHEPWLVLAGLALVIVAKPVLAMAIVALIGYPARTGLVVALGLAQIGEFSFILADLGVRHGLMGEAGSNVLIACALVSITLNPLLFRWLIPIENTLKRWPALWRLLNRNAGRRERTMNQRAGEAIEKLEPPVAIIVGYGPVGRTLDELLHGGGVETVVVDLNMDTVQTLTREGRRAIYGDAFNIEVMHQALARAAYLIIAPANAPNRNALIVAAKLINPAMKIFARARYISEKEELTQAGADGACFDEAETAVALAKLVLFDRGADPESVRRETTRIRQAFTTSG